MGDWYVKYNLDEVYYKLKNYQESILYLSNAVKINSDLKEYYQMRAKACRKLGETANVRQDEMLAL